MATTTNPAAAFGQTAENAGLSPTGLDLEANLPGLAGINPATTSTITSNLSAPVTGATSATAAAPATTSPNPADSNLMNTVYAAVGGDEGSY
jgi:hypothetical protein